MKPGLAHITFNPLRFTLLFLLGFTSANQYIALFFTASDTCAIWFRWFSCTLFLLATTAEVVSSHSYVAVQISMPFKMGFSYWADIIQRKSETGNTLNSIRRCQHAYQINCIFFYCKANPGICVSNMISLSKKTGRTSRTKKTKVFVIFLTLIKGQISFSELCREVWIESLQERQMNARLSLFSRCMAEGIEPLFQNDLEKKHNTR